VPIIFPESFRSEAFSNPLAQPEQDLTTARSTQVERWLETHCELVAIVIVGIGFVARLKAASGVFLNPDEALHFYIANQSSWALAYQASLTTAHPPLLIFVLYWWRHLGTSEVMLRLPSVIAGTAFCWICFQWLKRIFGRTVGLTALILLAFLPSMVALSAQVRQYELMLLFLISATYLLERGFLENSPWRMLASSACLYLAMLTHYSAFLFAATLGIYAALRVVQLRASAKVVICWIGGELGALSLGIFLYMTHISKIRGMSTAAQAFELWLYKSFFHPGHESAWHFAAARSFSVFQFLMGQLVIGDIAGLLFIAGIIFLCGDFLPQRLGPDLFQIRSLLILPFVLNCSAALAGIYPYGGTRHSAFLVIFAATGISLGLTRIVGRRPLTAIALAGLAVLLCYIFPTVYGIDIAHADQSRAQMEKIVRFVRQQIPATEPILVDYETGLELGYYLCEQQPLSPEKSASGFDVFHCGMHRIVSTAPEIWSFGSPTLETWNRFVRRAGFKPGETVWVAQAGWAVTLADELQKNYPEFRCLERQDFGRKIVLFKIIVD
jgi:dolichyl-phosphate-mannose-protein mannosyltransferase